MSLTKNTAAGFTAHLCRNINCEQTEFVFHRFANRWFLLITQYGKLPNLYTVQFDVQRNEAVPTAQQPVDHPQFHVSVPVTIKCNFGADRDEVRSGILFLVNKSNLNKCPTEFLIGLGIKELNGKNLRDIVHVLNEIIT